MKFFGGLWSDKWVEQDSFWKFELKMHESGVRVDRSWKRANFWKSVNKFILSFSCSIEYTNESVGVVVRRVCWWEGWRGFESQRPLLLVFLFFFFLFVCLICFGPSLVGPSQCFPLSPPPLLSHPFPFLFILFYLFDFGFCFYYYCFLIIKYKWQKKRMSIKY